MNDDIIVKVINKNLVPPTIKGRTLSIKIIDKKDIPKLQFDTFEMFVYEFSKNPNHSWIELTSPNGIQVTSIYAIIFHCTR